MFENLKKVLDQEGEDAIDLFKIKLASNSPYPIIGDNLYNKVGYRNESGDLTGFIRIFLTAPEEEWTNKGELWLETVRKAYGDDKTHDPPVAFIEDWMVRRGIPIIDGSQYAIKRKIGRDGILNPPKYVNEVRTEILQNGIEKRITEAIRLDVYNLIKKYDII